VSWSPAPKKAPPSTRAEVAELAKGFGRDLTEEERREIRRQTDAVLRSLYRNGAKSP
jgi:hypothetical protein